MEWEHELTLREEAPYPKGKYECNQCWLPGNGPVYHCSTCQYNLHPACVASSPKESHFLHMEHPLVRRHVGENVCDDAKMEKGNVRCNLCHLKVFSQWYECTECKINLHPACVRAPKYIMHPAHTHILHLEGHLHCEDSRCADPPGRCGACDFRFLCLAYRCKACPNFGLHVECMQYPMNPLLPSLHPAHRLALHFHPPYSRGGVICDKCKLVNDKWVYHCKDCKYDLHTSYCAAIPHHTPFLSSSSSSSLSSLLSPSSSSVRDPGLGLGSSSSVGTRLELHSIIRDIILSRHKMPSSRPT